MGISKIKRKRKMGNAGDEAKQKIRNAIAEANAWVEKQASQAGEKRHDAGGNLRFSTADMVLFAQASGDTSPLHTDPLHCRQTPFGEPLVYGGLGAMVCLGALTGEAAIQRLEITYQNPFFVDVPYQVQLVSQDEKGAEVCLRDGELTLVRLKAAFGETQPADPSLSNHFQAGEQGLRTNSPKYRWDDYKPSMSDSGPFQSDHKALKSLAERFGIQPQTVSDRHLDTLVYFSYLSGMVYPGYQGMSSQIRIDFHELGSERQYGFHAQIEHFDDSYGLLNIATHLGTEKSVVASGRLKAIVRKTTPPIDIAELADDRIQADALAGKTALVVGGSRGLGEALVKDLALRGAKVILQYKTCTAEAERIVADLGPAGERVSLLQGDAADPKFWQDRQVWLKEHASGLNLLICNAVTPLLPIGPGGNQAELRAKAYLEANLALAQTPVEALTTPLKKAAGTLVVVSDALVENEAENDAYLAMKRALESWLGEFMASNRKLSAILARPPRMQTDFSNRPAGTAEAVSAIQVADAIIDQLANAKPGKTLTLQPQNLGGMATQPGGPATERKDPLVISATFTVEPLEPALCHMLETMAQPFEMVWAPYNQLFQELLNPESQTQQNTAGINIMFMRLEDWLRNFLSEDGHGDVTKAPPFTKALGDYLEKTCEDFITALKAHAARAHVQTLIMVCPSGPAYAEDSSWRELFETLQTRIETAIDGLSNVAFMNAADYQQRFGNPEIFDPVRDDIGHIPFTNDYFYMLANLVSRRIFAWKSKPYKVIVLDCDNTLWKGVCGEVGPQGVSFEGHYTALQSFLIQQTQQGMVLCLASKNVEEDVWQVFDQREDMLLKREHIVDTRINWSPKSANIIAMAKSLNLGLDSFIFIDDNPVEVAEVRANAPEVLVIHWPSEPEKGQGILDHTWVFDHYEVTQEDQKRTKMYQANVERENLLTTSGGNFDAFIASLDLNIEVAPMSPATMPRLTQLTNRTNQFNFTTVRRTQNEVEKQAESGSHEFWTVTVSDRFGDYGLVGVMILTTVGNQLEVDSFMLSCRVLGRGVEYRMLAHIGEVAVRKGLESVKVVYLKTAKNLPAKNFIDAVGKDFAEVVDEDTVIYTFPAKTLSELRWQPKPAEALPKAAAKDVVQAQAKLTSVRQREDQMVLLGTELAEPGKVLAKLNQPSASKPAAAKSPSQAATQQAAPLALDTTPAKTSTQASLRAVVLEDIKVVFGQTLEMDPDQLLEDEPLETYVNDSFKNVEITVELKKHFPNVPSTVLFEHRNMAAITDAFLAENGTLLKERYADRLAATTEQAAQTAEPVSPVAIQHTTPVQGPNPGNAFPDLGDIAIIGVAGIYPEAKQAHELWQILTEGRSVIGEVPPERWDMNALFGPKGEPDKSYCKWGGFIADVDKFDPSFFQITPKEIEVMDPQQRLMLQVAWSLIEDAGYTRQTIERQTGVFVAVVSNDYGNFANEAALLGQSAYRWTDYYQIPNRVSYFFDFQGPSLAVDTACSGAGTALHLACQSLRKGDIKTAIVGGVNLFLHPSRFVQYSQMQMLTDEPYCRPFGAGANGTLFGEGIGALLLKPLADAERDGDHIYAAIKATAINSGGKTNGFTVPNPQAHASLISQAFRESGVDPRTISYMEAHGTGTSLGDPIEIRGLTMAYRNNADPAYGELPNQYCALGSLKANIGHLESAAAISSITKILLQMKHRQLVPSINATETNPLIDFANSPFRVQQKLEPWEQPTLTHNGKPLAVPRRAAVSSFGAGGSNAHAILEEYIDQPSAAAAGKGPWLIVLSAKTRPALETASLNLARFLELENAEGEGVNLDHLSYTLQIGREAMNYRMATVVSNAKNLIDRLRAFASGKKAAQVFSGHARKDKSTADMLIGGEEGLAYLQLLINNRKLDKLAQLWVAGVSIQWGLLAEGKSLKRLSLPTYPFEGERYWLPKPDPTKIAAANRDQVVAQLHPLIKRNVSTLESQGYLQTFTGKEFVLDHHIVSKEKVLPAVAYLEMARVAGNLAHPKCMVRKLQNIVWAQRFTFSEDSNEVHVNLLPHDGVVNYQVCTVRDGDKPVVHTSGKILYDSQSTCQPGQPLDLHAIRQRCAKQISREQCYKLYRANGFDYGPGFKPIMEMVHNESEALSYLELPSEVATDFDRYLLHPTLMDGALQTVIGLTGETVALSHTPWLPFGMGELEICKPLQTKAYAYVKLASNHKSGSSHIKKFEIFLTDEKGQPLVHIKDYSLRAVPEYQRVLHHSDDPQGMTTLYYRDEWKEMPVRLFDELADSRQLAGLGNLLVFDTSRELTQVLRGRLAKADHPLKVSLVTPGDGFEDKGDGHFEIAPDNPEDYRKLLRTLQAQQRMPGHILHLWSKGRFVLENGIVDTQFQRGAYSIFHLSKALITAKLRDDLQILYVFSSNSGQKQPQYAAVSGMTKTIQIENPKLAFKIIDLQSESTETSGLSSQTQATLLLTELLIWTGKAVEIRHKGGQRFAKYLQEFDLPKAIAKDGEAPKAVAPQEGGTYLITGGMGGLGKLFATHLAKKYKVNLVLAGRSSLDEEGQKTMADLQELGATVLYVPTDVNIREQVLDLVAKARKRFGNIDGIIHAAGLIRDGFVLKKTMSDFQAVLGPKVYGTMNLDEATSDDSLDFFVMFSSLTSLIGNIGQVDYALGNRFMDAYAVYRNEQVAKGKRSGKTLAINWPFWKEGGMRVDEASENALTETLGMRALESDIGLQAFEDGLAFSGSQFLVLEGAFLKVRKALRIAVVEEERQLNQARRFLEEPTTKMAAKPQTKPAPAATQPKSGAVDLGDLKKPTETFLKEVLSKETKLPMAKIIADEPLEEYGIDSVMILTLSGELEKVFGELSKTLLFEYQSIAELTDYFTEHHKQTLVDLFQVGQSAEPAESFAEETAAPAPEKPLEIAGLSSPRFLTGRLHAAPSEPTPDEDIAIIGVSGRYPLARNLAEFWENLQNGRDCIEEVPADRWDWRSNYDPDKNAHGKTYSKWGGFLDGVADFDPLFFNISPKEAGLIDPQERLFLETTWQALEDAGYTRGNFGKSSVGVYVGVMWGHYQLYGPEEAAKGNLITPDSSYASIANRVSYFFNFQGPSMAIDTMCSSSLTAIHLACEAIHRGEIKTAIAGGVNLSIHPSKYIGLSAGKFTSSDGRCRSFGQGGDGYVPGEGVGAVILKPLSQAIRHKDHIYAVIKGTSINHGGKTNGYTVPNPNAQGELVKLALDRADIDPRTISYIEAHGTGTALGDPIEITGLKRAYSGAKLDLQSTPIGSVKSNVGHLEAAAGIAGLTKILLQMKFRKIVPSLHSKVLNPNINFKDTPFYVNQHLVDWEQPTVKQDNHFKTVPRRAGISSFGAGGSNAHLIVEEFETPAMTPSLENRTPHIIVLSAKNEDRLHHYVRKMLSYLEQFGSDHAGALEIDEDLLAKIQYSIVRTTATILKVSVQEVESSEEFLELGLDQVGQASLLAKLNNQFDLELANDLFQRCPTIEEMALHLYRDFKEMFRSHFTSTVKQAGRKPVDTHINLTAMAFTLQEGREAMPERLAVVVENVDALMARFKAYLEGETAVQGMYLGNVRTQTAASGLLVDGEEGEAFLHNIFKKRRYAKIAQLWVSGVSIDWNLLYPNGAPQRISLPTYPFNRKRHWFPQKSAPSRTQKTMAVAHLHPLVGRNISNLTETKFVTDFNGESAVWLGKTAEGTAFLPHATGLEMGRAALATIGETASLWLRDMRWSPQVLSPVPGSHHGDAHIQLHLLNASKGQFGVEIFSQKSGRRHIHAQAILETNPDTEYPKPLDLEALQASLDERGPNLRLGEETALFHLPEPKHLDTAIVLNPDLLNGAIHAAAQLVGLQGLVQPKAAASLSFRYDFQKARWARVRRHAENADAFEVLFATEDGTIIGHWSNLQLQVATLDAGMAAEQLFSTLEWMPTPIAGTSQGSQQGDWLAFLPDNQLAAGLQSRRAGRGHLVQVLPGERFEEVDGDTFRINPANEADFARLLTQLKGRGFEPKQILHLWTLNLPGSGSDLGDSLVKVRKLGINAVHHLIKALSESGTKSAEGLTIFYPGQGHEGNPGLQALSGFSRSAARLFSKFTCRTVQVEAGTTNHALVQAITDEVQQTANRQQTDVRMVQGKRLTLKAVPFDPPKPKPLPHLEGALVISGGAGGLGLMFAHHFAEQPGAKLVLLGRSDLGAQRKAKLSPLEEKGAEVIYLRADVADRASLGQALERARERFGSIAGVIHAAGRNDETQLTKKPFSDFQATLQPKIAGTIHLDQLTQGDPLQFFVLFSSTSAFLGDFGQCDYAIGNRFMDHYAVLREDLRQSGQRHGRSLSIDWPLWRDGGMHLDEAAENFYLRTSGMAYLEREAGLNAFDALLATDQSHALILSGQGPRLRRILGLSAEETTARAVKKPVIAKAPTKAVKAQGSLAEMLMGELRGLVSELLHIETNQVDIHENLGDFGFDSISLTDFAERLSNRFEVDITPNLFFTHPTLDSLHEHFLQEHKGALAGIYRDAGGAAAAQVEVMEAQEPEAVTVTPQASLSQETGLEPMAVPKSQAVVPAGVGSAVTNEPIAIIGLAGMFPGSPDIESFWKNLHDEVDLVTEIPGERWNWRDFEGDPHSDERKTHCRWGGFVPDVDHFDARFFQISPVEANLMDPQHRLFLQTVWKAIEDAGYKASDLSGKPVGLYVGAQFADYAELLHGKHAAEPFAPTGNVHSILANRVSYLLNLRGPSEPINTACSSALVAIHHAVRAIQSGETTMAIAGAVCLMLTPTNMLDASQLSMLAKDGRCKTFDKSADGFVKGEGIGAVLLKPLSKAIADRDHIYGVVRGAGINHGGKANSLTAPNPNAQAELIAQTHAQAGFEPETISYVETHGTGTELGDPVEVDGLNLAFRKLANGRKLEGQSWCKLGAVKTNIGHLEPAAGIAGVTKVLMAMKYGKLPGTIHLEELNPMLRLKGSPFEVVRNTQSWERLRDASGKEIPRRAGVSSFGFGGVNGHVALEEYQAPVRAEVNRPCLIVLSARNAERLKAMAANLADHFANTGAAHAPRLIDVAFTLQMGREAMNERLAFVAENLDNITQSLRDYLAGKTDKVAHGNTANTSSQGELLLEGNEGRTFLETIFTEGKLAKLAKLWVLGVELDWNLLYGDLDRDAAPQRVSLPTYAFAPQRHWVTDPAPLGGNVPATRPLHPLLHQNLSDLSQIRYTTRLTGSEFFLSDHKVGEEKVLPGVAYLEMAGAAAVVSGGRRVRKINDIVWIKPLAVNGSPASVAIQLQPTAHHTSYQVFTESGSQRTVHTEGRLVYENGASHANGADRIDLAAIRQRCHDTASGQACYQRFETMDLHYGRSFQSVQTLWHNHTEALSFLALPETLVGEFHKYVLHPTLLDGALQTVSGLMKANEIASGTPYIPYALDEVEILRPMTTTCYAYVAESGNGQHASTHLKQFNVTLTDPEGNALIHLRDFTLRHLNPASPAAAGQAHSHSHPVQPAGKAAPGVSPLLDGFISEEDEVLI